MHAVTIAQLAWYLPRKEVAGGKYAIPEEFIANMTAWEKAEAEHYISCHMDLSFGAHVVEHFAKHPELPFPAFLHNEDAYLWRAYKFAQGFHDPVISGALALKTPGMQYQRDKIEALLLADDVHYGDYEYIENQTSIPAAEIAAYEKLFYNVMDRKEDHKYIESIVYPDGKLEYRKEEYIANAAPGLLMKEVAYTKDITSLLYLLGTSKENPFQSLSAAQAAGEISKQLILDGLVYVHCGIYDAAQFRFAQKLLNAMWIGKQDSAISDSEAVLVDDSIREMAQESAAKAAALQNKLQFDASQVFSMQDLNKK